jgi:predicted nucleotidyltransferase
MERRFKLSDNEVEEIKRKILSILLSYEVISFAYIYGSFGKSPFRDIDISAYCFISEDQVFDFEMEVGSQLEKETGFPVDFKVINFAPIGFQSSVINEGNLLFERDRILRLDFIEKLGLEYMDYYEFSKSYLKELVECIKK